MRVIYQMQNQILERLDLRDLLFFETIAESNHLGRAAKKLGRTQPALTRCVRRLEEALGTRLFERVGRGIRITPSGTLLVERVRVLRRAAEDTLHEVDDFENGSSGHVRVGSGPITAERLLPAVCREILAQGQGVTIEVVIGWNADLLEMLKAGNLDLVVGPVPEPGAELASRPLVDDVFVVAASANHRIFRKPVVKMRDLLAYGWVLPTKESTNRKWIDRTFELHGLPKPRAQIEANVISLLSSVIASSGLIGFVSRNNLRTSSGNEALREIPLKEAVMRRHLGITWRQDSYLSPVARRFVDAVKAKGLAVISSDTV